MHFYPHNIADFNNATRHLTRVQRSVYRDAIDRYYDKEQALDGNDFARLCRVLLCVTDEEISSLRIVLDEFFVLVDGNYTHDRCDLEIEKYRSNATAKAKAGKASAEARKNKCKTPVEHALNSVEQTNNQELITNNQETVTKSKELKDYVTKNKFSDEDKKCAGWLIVKLQEFVPDCKKPSIDGWAQHIRKMREIDNRDHKEICQLWLWCRKDGFESANVMSPSKLRERYDSLKTKMKSPASGANYASQPKSPIERFMRKHYPNQEAGSESDRGFMGGDDGPVRGVMDSELRGDTGRIGPMDEDIIGDCSRSDS